MNKRVATNMAADQPQIHHGCILCDRFQRGMLIALNKLAFAVADSFPVSPGHALIAPLRHESNFFALSTDEQVAMLALVDPVRGKIGLQHQPGGYNLGLNIGEVAGQTVEHAHLHVIPRYVGDVPDPRGGVRWVVPSKAVYWNL